MKRLHLATKQVAEFIEAIPMTAVSAGLLIVAARDVNGSEIEDAYQWVPVTICATDGPEQIRVRLSKELP
jgi:hypothetical protein